VVFSNVGKDIDFNDTSGLCTRDRHANIFELSILSDCFKHSFHIADLINCSNTIIQSEKFYDKESLVAAIMKSCDENIDPPNTYRLRNAGHYFSSSPDLYFAAQMASFAFGNAQKENAIYKYEMARDLTDINPLSLSPSNDWPERMYFHSDQLKYAYSIIACYSILEELNLEIKANMNNPSTIKDGARWNDSVLCDLKDRLLLNNISSDITIPWLARYECNRPFKLVVQSNRLCEWSDGKEIRDFYISICDAILELSYIRDCITIFSKV